jgi:hypothetical protein
MYGNPHVAADVTTKLLATMEFSNAQALADAFDLVFAHVYSSLTVEDIEAQPVAQDPPAEPKPRATRRRSKAVPAMPEADGAEQKPEDAVHGMPEDSTDYDGIE